MRKQHKVRFLVWFAAVCLCAPAAFALPHYYLVLGGGNVFEGGEGAMILNNSLTGASVVVTGVLDGVAPSSIQVQGVTIPRLGPPGALFYYQGSIYFQGGCCGSVSVGGLSGSWLFDYDPDILRPPPPPVPPGEQPPPEEFFMPRGDYSYVAAPPADVPEPSALVLFGMGGMALLLLRIRAQRTR